MTNNKTELTLCNKNIFLRFQPQKKEEKNQKIDFDLTFFIIHTFIWRKEKRKKEKKQEKNESEFNVFFWNFSKTSYLIFLEKALAFSKKTYGNSKVYFAIFRLAKAKKNRV